MRDLDFIICGIPVKEPAWTRQLGVRYRQDAYLSPAAHQFIDTLRTEAARLRVK